MSKTITVCMTIPISNNEWIGPKIYFERWIPEKDSDLILLHEGSKDVRIYIDKSCVCSSDKVTDELINSWMNISVSKLKVEVVLKDIEDELACFIYDERESPNQIHHGLQPQDPEFNNFQNEFKSIALEVGNLGISSFNRVISYARNVKDQYWLTEQKFDEKQLYGSNVRFGAKARIEDGEWFRWAPPANDAIVIELTANDERTIKQDEWYRVIKYVQSKQRPNLIFELLANSRQLFGNNYLRSSVIEAVTALDVAVSNFGKNANIEMLAKMTQSDRIDIESIGKQIEHLGFSGSIRFLIPLIFKEDALPKEYLDKCYTAIESRNNIVHNGQRNVAPTKAREILEGVSFCCKVLDAYTIK